MSKKSTQKGFPVDCWNAALLAYEEFDGNSTSTLMKLKELGFKIKSSKLKSWLDEGVEEMGFPPIHEMWLDALRLAMSDKKDEMAERIKVTLQVGDAYVLVLANKIEWFLNNPHKVTNLIGSELSHVFKMQQQYQKMLDGGSEQLASLDKVSLKEANKIGADSVKAIAKFADKINDEGEAIEGGSDDYGLAEVIQIERR